MEKSNKEEIKKDNIFYSNNERKYINNELQYLNIEDIDFLLRSNIESPIFLLVCGKECVLSKDYFKEFEEYKNNIQDAKFYHTYYSDIREIENISNIAVTPACYVFYKKKYYLEYLISSDIVKDIIQYLNKKYSDKITNTTIKSEESKLVV